MSYGATTKQRDGARITCTRNRLALLMVGLPRTSIGKSAEVESELTALLDFTVPRGLHFSISKSPNGLFRTTYAMDALPSLHGSIGYISEFI
ncbi:hypothetical protein BDM02DRAFT_3111047 [Thelephora ganbajun]|uniref:Uncharacterized protein n=1 Tax=Thelephora ganbajun TaxID=370292 RepID=A0ACB6ZML1_THEGA|nr:hypothetical protein BDM02DRAFT_3111047 [Thelephora ganbajun]